MDPDSWNALTPAQRDAALNSPAMSPPAGVQANLTNAPTHKTMAIGVTTMCVFLAIVPISIRVYSKFFIDRKVHLEDGLALIAFGTYVGAVCVIFDAIHLSGFAHGWDMTLQTMVNTLYPLYLLPMFYCLTMLFAKSAIIIEWLRIFVPTKTRSPFYWACIAVMAINNTFYVAGILFIGLKCRPVRKLWWPMAYGTCIELQKSRELDYSSSWVNLVLDLALLIIPQATIWKLRLPARRKIGVSLVFSLGVMACGAALGRVIGGRAMLHSTDRVYDTELTALCTFAEMTCAFIVFCAPAVPKTFATPQTGLIAKIARTLRSWSRIRHRNRPAASSRLPGDEHVDAGIYQKMPADSEMALAHLSTTRNR